MIENSCIPALQGFNRKYHSGTICKGVSNPQTSNALSTCEKEEIPKEVCRRYRERIRMKAYKSLLGHYLVHLLFSSL